MPRSLSLPALALAAVVTAVTLATGATPAGAQQQTHVDFSSRYTQRLQTLGYADVPANGILTTTGGVTFHVGLNGTVGGDNIWNANFDGGTDVMGRRTLDLDVDIANPTKVYTLLTTYWGVTTPGLASVEFHGSAGAFVSRALVGGTDMRDFLDNVWTNTINGTSTVNVYDVDRRRLDRLEVDLGTAFAGQRLTRIRFVDDGGPVHQRLMVSGITVASSTVPEPGTVGLLAVGLLALGAGVRQRRRVER